MALVMKYQTKKECARLWVNEGFMNADKDWFVTNPGVEIEYYGRMDYEDCLDEVEEGEFGSTHIPMWNTWFMPTDSFDVHWVEDNAKEIAQLGFTIIYINHENFSEIALGIDGAGYDFYEDHWIPLYELRGFKWHDEEAV